jgi:hypothetical protein
MFFGLCQVNKGRKDTVFVRKLGFEQVLNHFLHFFEKNIVKLKNYAIMKVSGVLIPSKTVVKKLRAVFRKTHKKEKKNDD